MPSANDGPLVERNIRIYNVLCKDDSDNSFDDNNIDANEACQVAKRAATKRLNNIHSLVRNKGSHVNPQADQVYEHDQAPLDNLAIDSAAPKSLLAEVSEVRWAYLQMLVAPVLLEQSLLAIKAVGMRMWTEKLTLTHLARG